MSKKKNDSDNSSLYIKDIDVYRSVLQTIFLYGCFDQNLLAEKSGYKKDKNKNAKKFYDTCLSDHIGQNYMINPSARRGRPSYATYLNYRRFTNNKNYLYSVYQWSSIARMTMVRYFIARQYICLYEGESDGKEQLKETIKDLFNGHNTFNEYFSICRANDYEHVYKFLESVCDENKMREFTDRLCDALTLYSRKAPFSVPSYSIAAKLRKAYHSKDEYAEFGDSEIWDFTYDNYDRILYDDAVYTVFQAIRKNQVIGYTRSYDSENIQYIIPLKIMNEFNMGRCYLVYGRKDSDDISVIRFDNIFNVTAFNVKDEYAEEHRQKTEILKKRAEAEMKNIWISGEHTKKNENCKVVLNNVSGEVLAYIKKYAPYYEYDKENNSVQFVLRKADDIKPFLRTLGAKVVISETENPNLYKEFSEDYSDINKQYVCKQDYHTGDESEIKAKNLKKGINKSANKIPDEYIRDEKTIKLFNPYNGYSNIMLEDIWNYLMCSNAKARDINIEPVIRESFKRNGFATEREYYGRMVKRFANDLRGIKDTADENITDDMFFTAENLDVDDSDDIKPIIVNFNTDNDLWDLTPVQIFTDYEYEYLYLMLQDPEARALLPDAEAEKLIKKLEKTEKLRNSSLNDIYITRFTSNLAETDYKMFHKNVMPAADAIHNKKKIHFTYNEKEVTGSPYRFMYSLRERVPRLIVKCDNESWIRRVNIDKMKNVCVSEEDCISDSEFEEFLRNKKKFIEIVIHKTESADEKNVFERALRLFSSYEKYTWDDRLNNDYIIAVAYYDFDVLIRNKDNKNIYRNDTIVSDILSLGKYAKVLSSARYKLPDENEDIPYDKDMYYYIKGIYSNLDKLYNG
ncbi:MAG: hypothetical protein PUB89_14495 [Oscillospiraceae bacterium]|nr:hypothetical protein [Oscillospiraceae bacterium]